MTVPDELKANIYTYIETLEGLIFLKAQKNQKLAMEVQMLSYYPSFFELPQVNPSLTEEEAQVAEAKMAQNEAIQTQNMENAQQDIEAAKEQEQQ